MKNQAENLRWLRSELERAYLAARRGKTSKPEVIDFDKVCKQELDALAREIHTREYKPKPSTTFIVNKPVKREILRLRFGIGLCITFCLIKSAAGGMHGSSRITIVAAKEKGRSMV